MSLMDLVRPRPAPQPRPGHRMEVMNAKGDTQITWDPENEESVNFARGEYNRLTREGYRPFNTDVLAEGPAGVVERKGNQLMREFDPAVGRILMVPHMQGG